MTFSTDYASILALLEEIDPVAYGKTRNFIDGAVTRLSPFISRGVLSTKMVLNHVLNKGYDPGKIEKFIQELVWRDYWQQVWIEKGNHINQDLKHPQWDVMNHELAINIDRAETGIEAIDKAIKEFYQTGYLHNHVRMYVASIACNVGKSHWKVPAQWMYYHLLDGDWASNALSWQWVAGTNANKKYYANQSNVNKYCYTNQRGSFLDISYEEFDQLAIPEELSEVHIPDLKTSFPSSDDLKLDPSLPLLIYNYYNLDPNWRTDEPANRVLLLEPSVFQEYPISQNSIDFMMGLSKNIVGIQVYVGAFDDLLSQIDEGQVFFKEHPLNRHYKGNEDSRDWMFTVKGYYPSFFGFWKKCKKELK